MTAPQGAPREAGRELDAEIAEAVMGAAWSKSDDVARAACSMRGMLGTPKQTLALSSGRVLCWRSVSGAMLIPDDGAGDNLPHYSTDYAAAMLVVERMQARRERFRATLTNRTFTAFTYRYVTAADPEGNEYIDGWTCEFRACSLDFAHFADVERGAPTLPLAICLAALAALTPHPTPKEP